jgi:hypothetical protein
MGHHARRVERQARPAYKTSCEAALQKLLGGIDPTVRSDKANENQATL